MGQAGSLLPDGVLVLGVGSRAPWKAVPSRIGAAIPGTAHPCLNPEVGRDHQVSKSSGSLSQLDSVPVAALCAPTWRIPVDMSPFIQAEVIDFFYFPLV